MSEIILSLIILALLIYITWDKREITKERKQLINAIIAKTPEQLRDLDFVDKVDIKHTPSTPPDYVPVDQLSNEEFMEVANG